MSYHTYTLSLKEYLYGGCLYVTIISLISYLFYYSLWPFILLCPWIVFFYKYMRSILKKKRDCLLTIQFKDALTSISGLLSTGASLENAIPEAKKELFSIYGSSMIHTEFELMTKKLQVNTPIEDIFYDFASRNDIATIHTFSQILSIAKQTGGDLRAIILSTTSAITTQMDVRLEIDTHLSGKKLELYIMSAMPLIIMSYIKLTQPSFFDPVYHNIVGIIVMSTCLLLYGLAVFLAYKIISITS